MKNERIGLETKVLAQTLEFAFDVGSDEFHLRIEIFECVDTSGCYVARVWRNEYFRIQPTFPQAQGEPMHLPSDEIILKEFEGLESPLAEPTPFPNLAAAREHVVRKVVSWRDALEAQTK